MSDTRFTPGPWLREGWTVYALVHEGWRKGIEQFCNRFWATVQKDRECPTEEAEANARLIASAPDLYAVLSRIMSDLPTKRDWLDPDLERYANETLKQARGEA